MSFLQFQNAYENTIIKDEDILPLMRLNYANKSLIYQSQLQIDSLYTESDIQTLISLKLSPALLNKSSQPNDLFENILKDKQIADFSELYINNFVSISEILKIRDDINGRKFREWLSDINYNKEIAYKELLSRLPGVAGKASTKLIRWAYPTIIGLLNPAGGVFASAFDSFILEKMLKKWHPSFFLDDVLSAKLNTITSLEHKKKKDRLVEDYFGRKIGRNELCPCGSQNKYKKCCGK